MASERKMGGLSGRLALVTGGGRGIGREIARHLAAAGADIALTYRRDREAAEEAAGEIRRLGRRAGLYEVDVERIEDLGPLVDRVVGELGPVGILINNAGVASSGRPVADTDAAEVQRLLNVHAVAPFELAKRVLPGMRTLGRGDIVMISSVATMAMAAGGAPYNMAKSAMEALALTLAKEERRHGVRVNIVAPGLTVTDMGRRLVKARSGQDIAELNASKPFGRVSEPADVAAAVSFLVSPENAYVSGQKINVDGGG